MSRYLELKREFHPRWNDFVMADYTCGPQYYDKTIDRNNTVRGRRTTIPRFLQARLRNSPRAVANGYEFPMRWSKRLRRLLKESKHWPPYRIVRHE